MSKEILKELGLSEGESKVYLGLLELGSTLAGPVIKKTGLHRGTTYQILQRLKEKGLVSSVIKGKNQYFEAANPDLLMSFLKEKQAKLQTLLPILKAKQSAGQKKQEVTVYSGIAGIKSVLERILEELKPGGKYYDFGVSGLFKEVIPSYWQYWQIKKKKFHITSKVIFNEDIKTSHPDLLKEYHGSARFHPTKYSSITDTIIYNDKVVLFIWTADPPIAIVIRNPDNANSYKNQFKLMWKFAKN